MSLAQTSIKKNIFFDYDDSSLRQESKTTLNLYIKQLNNNPDLYIRITGYSDSKGSSDYNKKLSQRRVQSVVGYLKEKGIDSQRIKSRSLGSTSRFSQGESEKSLEMNRRVEIVLIEKEIKEPQAVQPGKKEQAQKIHTKEDTVNKTTEIISQKRPKSLVEIENVVTHELKKIAAENIELEVPAQMRQGEVSVVDATISEFFIINLIKRLNNTTYQRISPVDNIEFSNFKLSSTNFFINKIEGEKLEKWSWEVTPNESGVKSITLSATMDIVSNKSRQTINVPIFLKTVDVQSTPGYYLSKIMSSGLYIVFLVVLALGIFTMVSKKDNTKNIKKD